MKHLPLKRLEASGLVVVSLCFARLIAQDSVAELVDDSSSVSRFVCIKDHHERYILFMCQKQLSITILHAQCQ